MDLSLATLIIEGKRIDEAYKLAVRAEIESLTAPAAVAEIAFA